MIQNILLVLLGAGIGEIIQWIRSRTAWLAYSVECRPVARSYNDALHGKISVLYNGAVAENLYFATATVNNQTGVDLGPFDLIIFCDRDSLLLTAFGANPNTPSPLGLSDNFSQRFERSRTIPDPGILTRHEFSVPVLNRGDRLQIEALLQSQRHEEPRLYLSIDHKGIKLYEVSVFPNTYGAPTGLALLLGGFFTLVGGFVLASASANAHATAVLCVILGIFSTVIGAVLYNTFSTAYRWVRSH